MQQSGPASDEREVAELMTRFLSAVTFPLGGSPDYSVVATLFSDGGRLIKNSGDVPEISTVDEFVLPRQRQVDAGQLLSFEETELADITELFGNVGHRFTAYRKRGTTPDGDFEALGMICTQFIRTPAGWRISSMAWDDARPGLVLPGWVPGAGAGSARLSRR